MSHAAHSVFRNFIAGKWVLGSGDAANINPSTRAT